MFKKERNFCTGGQLKKTLKKEKKIFYNKIHDSIYNLCYIIKKVVSHMFKTKIN